MMTVPLAASPLRIKQASMTALKIGVGAPSHAGRKNCWRDKLNYDLFLRFSVDEPADGISGERYMTICGYKANGERQSCPSEDRYPWLGDHCGGNTPCEDCDN